MSQTSATAGMADVAVVGQALGAVARKDWDRVAALLAPDVAWTLPGNSSVSGVATGPEAVLGRIRAIADANLTSEPQHVHIGSDSIVATIHNTATHPVDLDEWLAMVFTTRDGLIATIATHLSDIPMLERFYAALAEEA
jgi:uncharacterized protein